MTATVSGAVMVGRVTSMTVPLDAAQERRFARLIGELSMIDLHQHPLVMTADPNDAPAYLARRQWAWSYEAVRHCGWMAVATANDLTGLGRTVDLSSLPFVTLVDEIAVMRADLGCRPDVVTIAQADDIVAARQAGQIGVLPTVEHLAIGRTLCRVAILYDLRVRLAGLTYIRKCAIGDGQTERTDCGLSEFGLAVVERMNALGMTVGLSHTGVQTAHEAIERSKAPVILSCNAAHAFRPATRTRDDADFHACVAKGGLVGVTAAPNSRSDDPDQDIGCVLDHYDYLIKLLGPDHVGIGTDTLIGDHVGLHLKLLGRDGPGAAQAAYLNGLESPADGKNIIRGLIARGHPDETIRKVADVKALGLLRPVLS